MDPLLRFMSILRGGSKKFDWVGWRSNGGAHGIFTSYTAYANGYEIKLTFHDYRAAAERYVSWNGVFSTRGISSDVTHWIEFEMHDRLARFGRKNILSREMLFPSHPCFPKMKSIFSEIAKRSKIFTPHAAERLSFDQTFIAVCKDLITILKSKNPA
jgi:hypothetical protein